MEVQEARKVVKKATNIYSMVKIGDQEKAIQIKKTRLLRALREIGKGEIALTVMGDEIFIINKDSMVVEHV